jgi:hypothetical protein
MTIHRTLGFVGRSWARERRTPVPPDLPAARASVGLAAAVALDEAILAVMSRPGRRPRRADYERVGSEVREAERLFAQRGWVERPGGYHRDPPPLESPALGRGRLGRLSYELISFESGYEPWPGEPGADRWMGYAPNRTASALVLRHRRGEDRPWLVCLHGMGMGRPIADLRGFRATRLYRELGLNLVIPVLPLHGGRRDPSGVPLVSFDHLNTVHGMAQAVWDVRRVISWVRAQGPSAVGLYGLSLGGYVTALTAGVEPGLDLAMPGIPVSDFPALFRHHTPVQLRRRALEHDLIGETANRVYRVVSPLALAPLVPWERRYIFAGLGDRMATPWQAHRLWLHWDQPRIGWYNANHVGFFWSKDVERFVLGALADTGFRWQGAA